MVPPVTVQSSVLLAVVVYVLILWLEYRRVLVLSEGVAGLSLTVTLVLLVAEQLEAFVTLRLTVAVPLAPAVRSEERRVGTEGRAPPVTVQSRVPLGGVVAVLPVELAQTEVSVVDV